MAFEIKIETTASVENDIANIVIAQDRDNNIVKCHYPKGKDFQKSLTWSLENTAVILSIVASSLIILNKILDYFAKKEAKGDKVIHKSYIYIKDKKIKISKDNQEFIEKTIRQSYRYKEETFKK